MKDKIITAILVLIVGLFLLPLAKFNDQQVTNELKGFSARDIQFIESIGFQDNLDGSWSLLLSGLTPNATYYYFDYKPTTIRGKIDALRVGGSTTILVLVGSYNDNYGGGTLTLWGGDVS